MGILSKIFGRKKAPASPGAIAAPVRTPSGKFKKGFSGNPKGKPKQGSKPDALKLDQLEREAGRDVGVEDISDIVEYLKSIVNDAKKRGGSREAGMRAADLLLKHGLDKDQQPARIQLVRIPMAAQQAHAVREGDVIESHPDDADPAPVNVEGDASIDPMLPQVRDTSDRGKRQKPEPEKREAARSVTELMEPTPDAAHGAEVRRRERAAFHMQRDAMAKLGMDDSEPQTGFGSGARDRLNGRMVRQ